MNALTWLRAVWDRALGCALLAVGIVLLILGSVTVFNAQLLADQFSYIMSAGIGGLACVVTGATFLVTAAFHDEWRKLEAIEQVIRETDVVVEARPTEMIASPDGWSMQEVGP